MTYKSPSGVFNYTQVPDDAGDADIKVYVNGEEVSSGGGGSSDFSTAKVTIINNDANGINLYAAVVGENYMDCTDSVGGSASKEINIALYKGKAFAILRTAGGSLIDEDIETTGDIDFDDGDITITGNGTITYGEGGGSD